MVTPHPITVQTSPFITAGDHANSKYFEAIKILVAEREKAVAAERPQWQEAIDEVYALVADEIRNHAAQPSQAISFGTSGWRGTLGKDLFLRSGPWSRQPSSPCTRMPRQTRPCTKVWG